MKIRNRCIDCEYYQQMCKPEGKSPNNGIVCGMYSSIIGSYERFQKTLLYAGILLMSIGLSMAFIFFVGLAWPN